MKRIFAGGDVLMDLKSKQIKERMFLISFAIILMFLLYNIKPVWGVFKKIFIIFIPFIYGFGIAFIINIPMKFIEKKLFEKGKLKNVKHKIKRIISYVITLLIFIVVILIVSFIVIPELVDTVQDLAIKLPSYLDSLKDFVEKNLENNSNLVDKINEIDIGWKNIEDKMLSAFENGALGWVESGFSFATSIVSAVISAVLAFVFSIYLLLQKETLSRQFKKLIFAILPKKHADKMFYIGALSNKTFSSFFSSQLLEALIIGVLFLIPMAIFKFPYALTISILISITALIPIVGPFIGLLIGIFLILVVDIKMALWFLVLFIVLQQIESNLIYPHVAGKASGLPAIWILVAITVGANLMGVLGILLFVPISGILYTILSEFVNKRLKQKDIKV